MGLERFKATLEDSNDIELISMAFESTGVLLVLDNIKEVNNFQRRRLDDREI